MASLTDHEAAALLYDWRGFLARPDQIAPDGDWLIWLALAGRGFGKTELGAQWVKERVANGARSIAIVAETQKDLEQVMAPRLQRIYPPGQGPKITKKPVVIEWPNGAIAYGYVGNEPDQLRGPEFDTAWVDELAKYRYAQDLWDMLQFSLRLGDDPRMCVTTTPRPIDLIKSIIAGTEGRVHVTRGRTLDNKSNLAPDFVNRLTLKYGGTRLGRQELDAEVLGDMPGAIWTQGQIDAYRVRDVPDMSRIVISLDPAVTDGEASNEHGIIVAGVSSDQIGYVLDDQSHTGTPLEWAQTTAKLYRLHQADAVVVEVNNGGDMIAHTLRSVAPHINVREVRATRGKHVRAEPVAALYEQGRIKHVGTFDALEQQMCQMTNSGYQGNGSPDRVDALVWAFTDLFPDLTTPAVSSVPPPRRSNGRNGWML